MKALRKARGLTQKDLAERAGLSLIYIKKLEAGEEIFPRLPTLKRLARTLGADIAFGMETVIARGSRQRRHSGGAKMRRFTDACRVYRWASAMLERPPAKDRDEEALLIEIDLTLKVHRAKLQELLDRVEDRYLGLRRA